MTKLRSVTSAVKGRVQWCGPTALAAITGCGYEFALQKLKELSGQRVIKGVSNSLMLQALVNMGFHARPVPVMVEGRKQTLARWLRKRSGQERQMTMLVNVTRHYVTVLGRKIVDNKTKEPVWIRDYPHRRKRVEKAWMLIRPQVAQ